MGWKDWSKWAWILGISILVGLFWSSGDWTNFFMNLIIFPPNFDPDFLHNFLDNFSIGFFYVIVPLTALIFLFDNNTKKIIKAGIIGSIVFPILMILPRVFFFTPIPLLHKLFLLIFEPIVKGFFGTFIYILYYILIGFPLGLLIGYFYGKFKNRNK